MGLKFFSDPTPSQPCSPTPFSGSKPKLGEPHPRKFKILRREQLENAVVLAVEYEGCVNYDGVKILVYDDAKELDKLINKNLLDPHFLEHCCSPIARFKPTYLGWQMAMQMLEMLRIQWLTQSKAQ